MDVSERRRIDERKLAVGDNWRYANLGIHTEGGAGANAYGYVSDSIK